jgi:hypothetical protein
MSRTALQVELPVCPACSHVSKIPAGLFSGKGYCSGPADNRHKRMRMVPHTFVEVFEDREPVEQSGVAA